MTRKSTHQNLVNVSKIEELMELMKKHNLDVIQAETEAEKICLAKNVNSLNFMQNKGAAPHSGGQNLDIPSQPLHTTSVTTPSKTPEPEVCPKKVPDGHIITSPFVGTFYRSPSPDSQAFVDLESHVKKGQTLCIVEAMKLMNEIESDIDGKIVAILHENARPVEFGTPLFVVAPNS